VRSDTTAKGNNEIPGIELSTAEAIVAALREGS
jgi:hypothetical protein